MVNCAIEWFTKAGAKQNSQRLGKNYSGSITGSFFETLVPLTYTFDPKVIYDQYNQRFIVVALEQQSAPQTSRILVAVSKTNNPNDGWWFTLINSIVKISGKCWADYPGLAVGTDAIYITANMFSFGSNSYNGGRLWIIAKSSLYSGGTASFNVYDHITLGSGYPSTYQPAQMFETPQTNVGTFLLAYSGLSSGGIESVNVIRVDNPLTTPTFTGQNVSLGDIDNTTGAYNLAPQLGTATEIETNDRRSMNAVWRNNSLWGAFTVVPPSGVSDGEVTAHWVKISTSTLSTLALSDQGNIGGETIASNCYTFFPSIAVNSSNDMVVGFSASASTIYAGCYYTGRLSSDPAGYTINPDLVRSGVDYYVRTFGYGDNRWGDYSGACVDPADDQTFYVFNQYAITRGSSSGTPAEDGRWGTAFGIVPVSVLPVELSSFTAKVLKSSDVQLDWRTETEVNNFGFDIERKSQSESWSKIGFVPGHGNSNSIKNYVFKDNNISGSGKLQYRLKQIDNDGSFEYSDVVEVNIASPENYALEQNYPNPFNPSTLIKFSLLEPGLVKLKIYNLLGQDVVTLVNKYMNEGTHEVNLDMTRYPSGIYIYKLDASGFSDTKKMIYLR